MINQTKMDRRIDVIRHVAFEDLGVWELALKQFGSIQYFQAGVDELLNHEREPADLLIILGGPIGVYETEKYPFLNQELALISYRQQRNLPLIGVCLGAQLIAAAGGARVYPSGVKEIGWGPVTLTRSGEDSCLKHLAVAQNNVLHWHGDTFDLPVGATLLASTKLIRNQAFSLGRNTLALQFHAEADPGKIEPWLIGHACELHAAGISPSKIRNSSKTLPTSYAEGSRRLIDDWLTQISG